MPADDPSYKGAQVKLKGAQEWFSHLNRPAGAHGLAHVEGALLSSDEPEISNVGEELNEESTHLSTTALTMSG